MTRNRVINANDLDVYKLGFEAAMTIFTASQTFPKEERYSLTDQIRRSSRSVCANLAEAWHKRLYEAAFVSKISDCLAEASETQTWLEFAVKCGYLAPEEGRILYKTYRQIIGKLIKMISNPKVWLIVKSL